MLASIFAAKKGCEVTLFEKNEKLGKKLYITGKGRCNVTNNCDPEELLNSVVTNAKFLYSAFYTFTSQDMMEFLEEAGTSLKTERGNRVFPCSDHSSDVIRALERQMKKYGVRIHLKSQVERLLLEEGTAAGIILTDGSVHRAEAVIVATGGLSYPTTGSTGDGYRFAREAGHTVTDLAPSLVPLRTKEEYIPEMAGLSLKNVELTVKNGKKVLYRDFGEMMFTHSGITGPLVLSASARLGTALRKSGELSAFLDLKPALTPEQLDAWADGHPDLETWDRSLRAHDTLVVEEGGRILGFGDMTADGYLDRLFVHREAQGRGIASALCAALECRCSASEFTVHASRTAQPFFQGRGYQVVREQQVERRGVLLTNFLMVRPADGVEEKRK